MNRTLSHGKSKGGKHWVHPPEALTRARVIYNLKFLGHVEVDQPKGSDMVREAIRKMKFNKQIKRAEGQKSTKVELVISIDGIVIQDAKYKVVQYQYPLHMVSYCADDKSDKRMFTFIAKDRNTNKHHCFVLDSERSAEEITMTVGQAFDLAYRRFLDGGSGKNDVDVRKQLITCQKKIDELNQENSALKQRVVLLEKLLEDSKQPLPPRQPLPLGQPLPPGQPLIGYTNGSTKHSSVDETAATHTPLTHTPLTHTPLTLNLTNGTAHSHSSFTSPHAVNNSVVPAPLSPPPPVPHRVSHSSVTSTPPPPPSSSQGQEVDLFGAAPFSPLYSSTNPFSPAPALSPPSAGIDQSYPYYESKASSNRVPASSVDFLMPFDESELLDMQANFSRGLSFGTEDFSLDYFDPLKKPSDF